MVVIRLARRGFKKNPFYKIVVADKRYPRDGRYIEQIGYFRPMARGQERRLQLALDRFDHWLNQGATASERVNNLALHAKKGEGLTATLRSKAEQAQQTKAKTTKTTSAASEQSSTSTTASTAEKANDSDSSKTTPSIEKSGDK